MTRKEHKKAIAKIDPLEPARFNAALHAVNAEYNSLRENYKELAEQNRTLQKDIIVVKQQLYNSEKEVQKQWASRYSNLEDINETLKKENKELSKELLSAKSELSYLKTVINI